MSLYKPGDAVVVTFTTQDPATGTLSDADSLPAGALVRNGVAVDAPTISKISTGFYKVEDVIPADWTAGDNVELYIEATVNAIPSADTIFSEKLVAKRVGDLEDLSSADVTAAVPTAVAIRTELDANSTKLARLDVAVSSRMPTMAGSRTITISLDDGADPVAGALIYVWNAAKTLLIGYAVSDATGSKGVQLDDGTYIVAISDPSHTAFDEETLVVTADASVSYTGTPFDPGTSEPGTVRVYDWEYQADGATPIEGAVVEAFPTSKGAYQAAGGIGFEQYAATATTNALGYWYLDLAPAIAYSFRLKSRSKLFESKTTPASGSAQLRTIL